MNLASIPSREGWRRIVRTRGFWILALVLLGTTLLHYCTPQTRLLASHPLTRHAAERIVFIIVALSATFAFGQAAGLVTLALVVALMLPRALFISPNPLDATAEVVATTLAGYLVVRLSARERRAAFRLKTINAVTSALIQSLELEEILDSVLDRILPVMKVEAAGVYLLDEETQGLTLAAHRNLPTEISEAESGLKSATMLAATMA